MQSVIIPVFKTLSVLYIIQGLMRKLPKTISIFLLLGYTAPLSKNNWSNLCKMLISRNNLRANSDLDYFMTCYFCYVRDRVKIGIRIHKLLHWINNIATPLTALRGIYLRSLNECLQTSSTQTACQSVVPLIEPSAVIRKHLLFQLILFKLNTKPAGWLITLLRDPGHSWLCFQ